MVKKADVFVVFAVLLCCVIMLLSSFLKKNDDGVLYVIIYVDGKKEYSYLFNENTKETVKIKNKYGYNEIIIEDSCVFVKEADCKSQDCVNKRAIKEKDDFIICSPHRLLVKIIGESNEDVQAVSY